MIAPLRSMQVIVSQVTVMLLEVVVGITSRGGAEGAMEIILDLNDFVQLNA